MSLNSMLTSLSDREFGVLYFSKKRVLCGVFSFQKGCWTLQKFAKSEVSPESPGADWQRVLNESGCSKGMRLLLTGALPDSTFLTFKSIEMPVAARREALAMDLPRQLPKLSDSASIQFWDFPSNENGETEVNVCVLEATAVENFVSTLSQCDRKVEAFCYPLLGVSKSDKAIYIPDLEPGYCWSNGKFCSTIGRDRELADGVVYWKDEFNKIFRLPEKDFSFVDFMPVLLTARLVISPDYPRLIDALEVIPDKLRQARYRVPLRVAILLLALIIVVNLLSSGREWASNYSEYYTLSSELSSLQREKSEIQSRLRRTNKIRKEHARIVSAGSGEHEVLQQLYDLSRVLPSNVRIVSLRWDENHVSLMLNSESETLNLPTIMQSIPYWKIGQVQQRQGKNAAFTTFNVRLERVEQGVNSK